MPCGVESKLKLQQAQNDKTSKMAGRLPEQKRRVSTTPPRPTQKLLRGLVGNPDRSAFCPRRGCLQLFLLLITIPHTKDVRLVRKAADSGL